MLEAELIISSDDLDEEYEMLQKKYGKEIDNIEFFMYIKRRVNAAYNKDSFLILFMVFLLSDHHYGPEVRRNLMSKPLKTRVFTHRLTHALMGRHCPSKYKFPNEWMFEDSCIYENVVAIGQPTGYITLIDMNSQKMILELSVFEQQIQAMRRPERFRWNEG